MKGEESNLRVRERCTEYNVAAVDRLHSAKKMQHPARSR